MISSENRRWWALGALSLSVLVVGLDLTVLNLALPTLAGDLHASTGDLQWFIDAYSLVLAAALLPAGLLGDRFGRKKLLTDALVLFGVASLACAYAGSAGQLIAARAVLGLAAAVILPLSLAVLPVLFSAEERPRAIAAVGGATFLGYPIGPILGGWLLDHFWWGSVFLINIPVVVIAVAAAFTMAAGAVVLAGFVGWERWVSRSRPAGHRDDGHARRRPQPLVDLRLFGSAGFTWGTALSTLVSFALFGLVFAMPQYFLDVRGFDSLGAGLRMLPMIGGLAVGLIAGQRLQTPRK